MSKPQLTDADLDEIYRLTCPHCAAGIAVRQRTDTHEFVHDRHSSNGNIRSGHTFCLASGLRNAYRVE